MNCFLQLVRYEITDKSASGQLFLNGVYICDTLEDPPREKKIHGKTAIPDGFYEIDITHSNRFKRDLPLLINVPGFTAIRIHSGNKPEDTEGCILVGESTQLNWISNSRKTEKKLMVLLCDYEGIFISVHTKPGLRITEIQE